jgi:hypothetical protein
VKATGKMDRTAACLRGVVPKPAQTYEPEVPVEVGEWIAPALASPDLARTGIQHWKAAQFLYDWQTLIASGLALFAAWRAILATKSCADQQIAAARRQIEETLRREYRHEALSRFAFYAMLEAAMKIVLADAEDSKVVYSYDNVPGPEIEKQAYAARKRFSKKAFNELRGACVSHGWPLTEEFLELENKIDQFASQTKIISTTSGESHGWGEPNNLLAQREAIEAKAKSLEGAAVAGMGRENAVIAETEAEPPNETPLKRPWWRRPAG